MYTSLILYQISVHFHLDGIFIIVVFQASRFLNPFDVLDLIYLL